jgi:hypothetical protein
VGNRIAVALIFLNAIEILGCLVLIAAATSTEKFARSWLS